MSLLSIVTEAAALVGVDQPTAVANATDANAVQFRALAQQEGDELSRAHDWRRLKVQGSITGDGSTEFWDLPADYDRQMAGDNLWLSSRPMLALDGPISDQDMLSIKAGVQRPTVSVWRYFGNQLQVYPVLTATQVVTLEYRSSSWILAADGTTTRDAWVADTDTAVIPERIIKLGVIWRWKRSKGLDYAEEFATYQLERAKAARADGGFRTLRARESFSTYQYGRRNAYTVTG